LRATARGSISLRFVTDDDGLKILNIIDPDWPVPVSAA
jgi:hypothetical protein